MNHDSCRRIHTLNFHKTFSLPSAQTRDPSGENVFTDFQSIGVIVFCRLDGIKEKTQSLGLSRENMTHIKEKSVKTFSPLRTEIRVEGRVIVLG